MQHSFELWPPKSVGLMLLWFLGPVRAQLLYKALCNSRIKRNETV